MNKILVGGSRSLSRHVFPKVEELASYLAHRENTIFHVGDARGADLSWAWAFHRLGVPVITFGVAARPQNWPPVPFSSFAGGAAHIPFRARLAARSRAAAAGCSLGVFVLDNASSKGSLTTAAYMLLQAAQILIFTTFPYQPDPLPVAGRWCSGGKVAGFHSFSYQLPASMP